MNQRSPDPPGSNELLDPKSEERLAELLRSAFCPAPLSDARNRQLVELALEDPFAAASAEELVESERLRRALAGQGDHPHAALARALQLATRPERATAPAKGQIAKLTNARHERDTTAPSSRRSSGIRRFYVIAGGAAALSALAASILLLLIPAESRLESSAAPSVGSGNSELSEARSTQELFSEKFEPGETSRRVDRIASVRARELRENQYALWGVR
jgi:hypothetical protein